MTGTDTVSVNPWSTVGDLADTAAGIGFGIYDRYNQDQINSKNLELAKDLQSQNQTNIETSWMREDNAVRRRVADLKASGINPLLAAGSAAGSSMAPMQRNAPEKGMSIPMTQLWADITRTRAENRLLEMQAKKVEAETQALNIDNKTLGERNEASLTSVLDDIAHNREIRPHEIESIIASNKGKNIDNEILETSRKIGINRLTQEELNTGILAIEAAVKQDFGHARAEAELLLLQLTLAQKQRDEGISQFLGIRSTDPVKAETVLGGAAVRIGAASNKLADVIAGLIDKSYDKKLPAPGRLTPEQAAAIRRENNERFGREMEDRFDEAYHNRGW